MKEVNKHNITIECGADFEMSFVWLDDDGAPHDLTDAMVTAQLRETSHSPDAYDFTCSHTGEEGEITIAMSHDTTSEIAYSYGVYDIKVELSNGKVYKPRYGDVRILDDVTKE